jgi:hypothetical protein
VAGPQQASVLFAAEIVDQHVALASAPEVQDDPLS